MKRLLATTVLLLSSVAVIGCLKPKPKKPFGEPCTSPIDCESLKCNTERGGICTKECHADSECTNGLLCAGDPTGTGASCAKPQGSPTGSACVDRSSCDHGSCLHKGEDEQGFCAQRCMTSNDCPANFKVCLAISDMGAQKFCLPGATANDAPPKIGVKKGGTTAPAKPGSAAPPKPTTPPPAVSKK